MKYILILLLIFSGCCDESDPPVPPTPPTDPSIPPGATVKIIMKDGAMYYSCDDTTNRECYNYPDTRVDDNYYKFANLETRQDIYIRKDAVDKIESIYK